MGRRKLARKLARRQLRTRSSRPELPDIREEGEGAWSYVTISNHDGSVVIRRFHTEAEVMEAMAAGVAADTPLGDVGIA